MAYKTKVGESPRAPEGPGQSSGQGWLADLGDLTLDFVMGVPNPVADYIETQEAAENAEEEYRRQQAEAQAWEETFRDYSERVAGMPETEDFQRREGERADEYLTDVNQTATRAGERTAQAYASRGMQDSGYAQAGMGEHWQRALDARQAARNRAFAETFTEGLGLAQQELAGLAAGSGASMADAARAMQMAMFEQQRSDEWFDQLLSAAGTIVPFALGGPAGGAAALALQGMGNQNPQYSQYLLDPYATRFNNPYLPGYTPPY